jgi:hypothetical protein
MPVDEADDLSNDLKRLIRLPLAYHEAGHGVSAYYLGLVVTSVGIGLHLREGAAGLATYRHRGKGNAYRDLVVACAGPIAEARFRGRPLTTADDDSGAGAAILREQGWPPSFLAEAKMEAENIILREDVWSAVEILATAIDRHQVLTGRGAALVIRRVLSRRAP